MSTKSHIYTRCETLRTKIIFHKGVCRNSHTRLYFDNNKGIQKIVVLKIQMVRTCFGASSTYKIIFF
jgi:hypothetical protein